MSTVSGTSSVLDQYQIKQDTTQNKDLGKNEFLNLLVAQLNNQNRWNRRVMVNLSPNWRSSARWKGSRNSIPAWSRCSLAISRLRRCRLLLWLDAR